MSNDRKRTDRTIELTIDIDATLEEVWQALTTGEGIARWFAPYAAVTPGEGGSVSVGWDPKEMWETPITVWEPQRRMQTVSEMPSKDGRVVRLAVDYYLEVQGGRVRVRLVHSGFDDSSWDDYIDGLDAGWSYFLFNLKHALERHRGVARSQQSARFRTTARAGEDHPVFGAKGLRVRPPIGGLRPGDACRLSLGTVDVDATVAVRHASRTIAFVVPAWNDALLFVEREGMKETHQLG
ncbi:MAG TPA: SRPBCC domain-containing protein, partial [Vicinamibacterales bacterium]